MWRRQLPVHSPLTAEALGAGLGAMLRGRGAALESARALLRERYGARRVVLTDSGTSALTLALRAVREERGEAVAVPAFSCYDVGTAWKGAGVRPLLYDLEPGTLSPDPESLQEAVEDGAEAVVLAYLYGVPIDWALVRRSVQGSRALLVEDAAQAVGCRWREERAGSVGDLSVLSFGRGKGWTAAGGGALLALSDRGASALSRLEHGELRPASSTAALFRAAAQWALARPRLYALPSSIPGVRLGETVYRPPSPEGGASTFSLGALAATEPLLEEEARIRRQRGRRLLGAVEGAEGLRPVRGPGPGIPGRLRLPVLADERAAGRLEGPGAEDLGVMPSYPRPLYRLPQLREDRGRRVSGNFPGADRLASSLFTLPTHGLLDEDDLRRLRHLLRGRSGAAARRPASPEPGRGTALRPFAVLSAVSLLAYLALSGSVRAFLRRAGELAARVLQIAG